MRKIYFLCLTLSIGLFTMAQCPTVYKINNGGGNCGGGATGRIALQFTTTFSSYTLAPQILSVSASKTNSLPAAITFSLPKSFTNGNTSGGSSVDYCYGSSGSSDNIFTGSNVLYFTISYDGGVTTSVCTVGVGNPLPIKLSGFSVLRNGTSANLTWQTEEESNNAGFYLQRNNGDGFKDVAYIFAQGKPSTYSFKDLNISNENTHYRLKSVNKDGSYEYSMDIMLLGLIKGPKFIISNPNRGQINLQFSTSNRKQFLIYDSQGRMIYKDFALYNNTIGNLLPGIYYVKVVEGNTLTTKTISIQ